MNSFLTLQTFGHVSMNRIQYLGMLSRIPDWNKLLIDNSEVCLIIG